MEAIEAILRSSKTFSPPTSDRLSTTQSLAIPGRPFALNKRVNEFSAQDSSSSFSLSFGLKYLNTNGWIHDLYDSLKKRIYIYMCVYNGREYSWYMWQHNVSGLFWYMWQFNGDVFPIDVIPLRSNKSYLYAKILLWCKMTWDEMCWRVWVRLGSLQANFVLP